MTLLATVDEAKAQLNLDHGLDDTLVETYIEAASAVVLDYVGDSQYLFLDTGGDPLDLDDTSADQAGLRARHRCKQATLLLVGDYYRNRSTGEMSVAAPGTDLPVAIVAILRPLRTPTVA